MNQYLQPIVSKKLKHSHTMVALELTKEGTIKESEEVFCGNSAGTRKGYIRRTVLNLFNRNPKDREVVNELNWLFDQLGKEMSKLTRKLGQAKKEEVKVQIGEALQTLGQRAKAIEHMLKATQPEQPEPAQASKKEAKPPKTPATA